MITQGLAHSFLSEMLQGLHQAGDVYRMALYTSKADLNPSVSKYTPEGEVTGGGYGAGGLPLVGYKVASVDGAAVIGWQSPTWPGVTVQARGAMIYNYSRDNRVVAVLDFEKDITSTNGNYMVTLPDSLFSISGGM